MASVSRWGMLNIALFWSVDTSILISANRPKNANDLNCTGSTPFSYNHANQKSCEFLICHREPRMCRTTFSDVATGYEGYSPFIPPPNMGKPDPVTSQPSPVKVGIGFSLVSMDYNIFDAKLELKYWLRLIWYDQRLDVSGKQWAADGSFNPQTDSVPITIKEGEAPSLWIPDMSVMESTSLPSELADTLAALYPTEHKDDMEEFLFNVMSSRYGSMSTYCPADLRKFPFDSQTCNLTFSSWAHPDVAMKLVPFAKGFQQVSVPDSDEYHFEPMTRESLSKFYESSGKNFSQVRFFVKLKRLPMYYVLNLVLPMFMMVVISNLTFWIPINNDSSGSGERIGFAVTCVLTISAIGLFSADKRPNIGRATWLDRWISSCLLFTLIPVVQTVAIFFLNGAFDDIQSYKTAKKEYDEMKMKNESSTDLCKMVSKARLQEKYLGRVVTQPILWWYNSCLFCKHYLSPKKIDILSRHFFPLIAYARLGYLWVEELFSYRVADSNGRYDQGMKHGAFLTLFAPLTLIAFVVFVLALFWMICNCGASVAGCSKNDDSDDEDEDENEDSASERLLSLP